MKVTIDIPKEFVSEYNDDKFWDSLERLKHDAHLLAGNFEKELIDMLIKAFKDSKEEDTPKSPTPPHPRWIPKESEFYYYIGDTGGIHIDRWNSDNIDDFRFSTGNVFPRTNVFDTSAEAEFVVEHLKVLAEMREWSGNWNEMTLHELERKLVELDELRTELKSTIDEVKSKEGEKPKPPHPRPYPEDYQFYYYINPMGDVEQTKWTSEWFELRVREIGNVFKTKAEAEFAAERLKVLAEMREWAGRYNDPWYIYYSSAWQRLEVAQSVAPNLLLGELRFAAKKDAENCVKTVGEDRIKKYYFMIPEDEADDDKRA